MGIKLPTITGITPNNGPEAGGNNVTIKGSNFNGVTSVNFGTALGDKLNFISDSEITVIAPKGKGNVDVTVITDNGKSSGITYTYCSVTWKKIWGFINTPIISGILIVFISNFINSASTNQKYTYYYRSNPIHDLVIFFAVVCIMVVIIPIVTLLMAKISFITHPVAVKMIISWVICLIIVYPLLIQPMFEITKPNNGSYVEYTSTVSGIGAIPGSPINVYIVDKYGLTRLVGTATPTSDGLWECDDVTIGQYGTPYAGQNFTIFANFTKDNKSYETPYINVIRS